MMAATEDFIRRMEMLLDHYGVSTSAFADKIGVQRSGISHLLSGRNKPSLDFIMKIISAYPEVDLYWLLTGAGNLTRDADGGSTLSAMPAEKIKKGRIAAESKTDRLSSEIDKIVIFYSDGTFSHHKPK